MNKYWAGLIAVSIIMCLLPFAGCVIWELTGIDHSKTCIDDGMFISIFMTECFLFPCVPFLAGIAMDKDNEN